MTSPTSGSRSTPSSEAPAILGVDPGSDKTGIAVVASDGHCVFRAIVPSDQTQRAVADACSRYGVSLIAIGDGTRSERATTALGALEGLRLLRVDERHSTEEARALYLAEHPARGLARLIPRGLRTPPCPVDDYAAWVIGRRALAQMAKEPPSA